LSSTALIPINDHDSRLAVELAVGISPVSEILKRHDLTKDELRAKLGEPSFRSMLKEAKRVWNSDLSAKERIRLKSQILVEDSLIGLYQIFNNDGLSPAVRIDAFKTMSKAADVDTPEKVIGPTGGRVIVNLNFGEQRQDNPHGFRVPPPIDVQATVESGDDGSD